MPNKKRKNSKEVSRLLATASDDDLKIFQMITSAMAEPLELLESNREDQRGFHVTTSFTGNDLPPHSYYLAKDTYAGIGYGGPAWVPHNLWMQYADVCGATGPNPKRTKECASKLIFSAGAESLWEKIAQKYERPDSIAIELPYRCADFLDTWQATPRQSPAEFKESRLRLKAHADQLAIELARFFDRWEYGYASPINFTQLLSEDEQERMNHLISLHNHEVRNRDATESGTKRYNWAEYRDSESAQQDACCAYELFIGDRSDSDDRSVVPNLPDLLHRIGKLFAEDSMTPPHQRPHHANASRNYFARHLVRYFCRDYGSMSPTIVAGITSIFFSQGITDNEVSKQLDFLPDGRRLPLKVKLPPQD